MSGVGRRRLLPCRGWMCVLAAIVASQAIGAGAAAARQVDVEVGASREILSGDRDDWEEYWVRVTVRPAPGSHAYGGWRQTRRFGQEDQQYEAGGGTVLSPGWSVAMDGTWSPTHRVLPRWGASGSLRRSLPGGWGLSVGGGRRVYDVARVDHQFLQVDRSVASVLLAYRLRFHQVEPGGRGIGHLASATWSYGAGSSVRLALGTGREATELGPDRVETTTFRSGALQGTHWLDPRTGLTYRFSAHRQGDHFTRTSTSIGVRRRL